MNLSDMIVGKKYLVGDGYGYDEVTCLGVPTNDEIAKRFGAGTMGSFMKVEMEDGRKDIFMESPGYSLYIEPR